MGKPKLEDFTSRRLVAELAERGLSVDYRAVWNFVHAEKLTGGHSGASIKTASSRYATTGSPLHGFSTVIRAAGAKLFFLPTSPDLNPIEQDY
jgi:hypothetical protein